MFAKLEEYRQTADEESIKVIEAERRKYLDKFHPIITRDHYIKNVRKFYNIKRCFETEKSVNIATIHSQIDELKTLKSECIELIKEMQETDNPIPDKIQSLIDKLKKIDFYHIYEKAMKLNDSKKIQDAITKLESFEEQNQQYFDNEILKRDKKSLDDERLKIANGNFMQAAEKLAKFKSDLNRKISEIHPNAKIRQGII